MRGLKVAVTEVPVPVAYSVGSPEQDETPSAGRLLETGFLLSGYVESI